MIRLELFPKLQSSIIPHLLKSFLEYSNRFLKLFTCILLILVLYPPNSDYSLFLMLLCSGGDWMQGLVYARQVLHYWAISPALQSVFVCAFTHPLPEVGSLYVLTPPSSCSFCLLQSKIYPHPQHCCWVQTLQSYLYCCKSFHSFRAPCI